MRDFRKPLLFIVCLIPFLDLVWRGFHAGLGVNPVEFVEHCTGDWALRFFCFTLMVRPLARLSGWYWWMRQRRMIGLFVFFYALLHFLTYLTLDIQFSLADLLKDIVKRPYITVGFTSFVMITALAVTSTDGMIRRLKRWWGRIHSLVYAAAMLGVIHYSWLVKKDKRKPMEYLAIISVLLAYRFVVYVRTRKVEKSN